MNLRPQAELEELLATSYPDDPFGRIEPTLYLTAAMTGLRQGELLGLRWRDVDFDARKLCVVSPFVRGEFGDPKSAGSGRSVPMAERVAIALGELRERSYYAHDRDLAFCHPETGKPLDRSKLVRRFKPALDRAGVHRITFPFRIPGRRTSCSSPATSPRGRSSGYASETPTGPTRRDRPGSSGPTGCSSSASRRSAPPPPELPEHSRGPRRRFRSPRQARPDEPLRAAQLAQLCGWSTPQTASVLKGLDAQGWTAKREPARGPSAYRELVDANAMLAAWSGALAEQPRDVRIAHRATRDAMSILRGKLRAALDPNVRWAASGWAGLELAAPFTTTVPTVHVYVRDEDFAGPLSHAIENAGLRELDEGGRFTFWRADERTLALARKHRGLPVASPPRLYADLSSFGARGQDAADHVKTELIDPLHPASGTGHQGAAAKERA